MRLRKGVWHLVKLVSDFAFRAQSDLQFMNLIIDINRIQ